MKKFVPLLLAIGVFTAGCSSSQQTQSEPEQPAKTAETAPAPETAAETTEENAVIALVSPEAESPVPMGDAELILEVTDANTGEPLALEELTVKVSMEMEGMEPMTSPVELEPGAEPGRYKATTYFGMQGMWEVHAEVKNSAHHGRGRFMMEVQ
ncbi:MAG: FixH family protein [Leptolyngbyaceae cyanobacterium MO_188.B28]|nr:FixH family protein [Leptolyngbyaceae cyanobacterium MO_188.B28]